MILTLAWKEYREHRAIWLAMVAMTGLMGLGLVDLVAPQRQDSLHMNVQALMILGMAAAYGVVCGAMMLAGEKESGTLVFLDIFLGRRGLLWLWKLLIGIVLAVTEALAVASVLCVLDQTPARWLPMVIGGFSEPGQGFPGNGTGASGSDLVLWLRAAPLVTLEAFAWGLLGSTLTRRVLSGAGLAVLMAAPIWLFTIFAPPPVFLGFRLVAATVALAISLVHFMTQSRDIAIGPAPGIRERDTRKRRLDSWLEGGRLEPIAPRLTSEARSDASPAQRKVPSRGKPPGRHRSATGARSPVHAVLWLVCRQGVIQIPVLAGVTFLISFLIPSQGQIIWPIATIFIGVLCGTAAFAQEQSDLSYQHLAAQHLPLTKVWTVKVLFWLAVACLLAMILIGGGALSAAFRNLLMSARESSLGRGRNPFDLDPRAQPAPDAATLKFGTLHALLGPMLFFGVWLAYGFAMGQVFVLFCRKTILAVILASLATVACVGVWMPSLLCLGMSGWPMWIPPLVLLAATRALMRAWAGGRIKERKPLIAAIGFGTIALAWASLLVCFRAWEIPDAGEPLDRTAYQAALPTGASNRAGQKIMEALGNLENKEADRRAWLANMEEVARLPVGVLEDLAAEGPTLRQRHLEGCWKMTAELRALAEKALTGGKPARALDHVNQILALSRSLRNKSPLPIYLAGVEIEASALEGLDLWLAREKPAAELLRRIGTDLDRHQDSTPGPLSCLQAECFAAGAMLDNPFLWRSFRRNEAEQGRIPEKWLANWVAFSLDVPWEKERSARLWRAVWAGLFRAAQAPPGRVEPSSTEEVTASETTRTILRGWLPATDGPDSSVTVARLARLLDDSWLSDQELFVNVPSLRAAAARARWRLAAARLQVALVLYQVQERKSASLLTDLTPKYLAALPVDPYTGQNLHYRISGGETISTPDRMNFQGRNGRDRWKALPGQAILWSAGPDGIDDGGRKHGGQLGDDDSVWVEGGFDLIRVVP